MYPNSVTVGKTCGPIPLVSLLLQQPKARVTESLQPGRLLVLGTNIELGIRCRSCDPHFAPGLRCGDHLEEEILLGTGDGLRHLLSTQGRTRPPKQTMSYGCPWDEATTSPGLPFPERVRSQLFQQAPEQPRQAWHLPILSGAEGRGH